MFKTLVIAAWFLGATAFAQQQPTPTPSAQPQVKLNYLNVCGPSEEEQTQIKNALDAIPSKAAFIQDFEITRGVTTLKDAAPAKFVRLRREFSPESPFLTAQFSLSTDAASIVETLVLRTRDPKNFHEISFEDRATSGAASPQAMLTVDTPVNRIRVERLTKSSVVLARCEGADQSAYEPLFRQASNIMAQYRQALGLRGAFRSDLAWLSGENSARHNEPSSEPKKKPK